MKAMKLLAAGLAAAGGIWFMAGCEEVDTDSALAITPDSAQLSGKGATVFMTAFDPDGGVYGYSPAPNEYIEKSAGKSAQDPEIGTSSNLSSQIALPLVWRVSNPALGGIAASGGYSAVYESSGVEGQNYVYVEDQFDRQGVAVIVQRRPVETGTIAAAMAVMAE